MVETNESLLQRLRTGNAHEAWREFYDVYWGAILRYARKLGLNAHQSEDVLQETMVTLMRILPDFAYDRGRGRFRNFLLTIVHRKSLAVLRGNRRQSAAGENAKSDAIADVAMDGGDRLQTEAIANWREAIYAEALRRLRDDAALGEGTFAIFHAYAIEEKPAAEVARHFGVKENAVYQIKNRLLRRLQRDVAEMMRASGAE
jgi:RNA polymerase sigma factor (sigma-70 family)